MRWLSRFGPGFFGFIGFISLLGLVVVTQRANGLRRLLFFAAGHKNGHQYSENLVNQPVMELPRLHQLPVDAARLARDCAEHLELDALKEPLESFLANAGRIDGLIGIGLAVWPEKPTSERFFTIYALSDFRDLRVTDHPSPRATIAKLYEDFQGQVKGLGHLAPQTRLSFINTRKERVPELTKRFPEKIATPFREDPPGNQRASLARLAACDWRAAA